jgi:hypothetical protein
MCHVDANVGVAEQDGEARVALRDGEAVVERGLWREQADEGTLSASRRRPPSTSSCAILNPAATRRSLALALRMWLTWPAVWPIAPAMSPLALYSNLVCTA